MDKLKEPRFWITVLIAGGVIAWVLAGKLGAEAGLAGLVGLLLRWGNSRATAKVKREP
jgi:hypothetical protein